MSTTICIEALHSIDDPEEHVGGVQQDGHGQLRRRGGRGGQWQVHLSSVLLGEEKHTLLDSGAVPIPRYIQGQFNVPGKGIKLSKFVSSPLIDWELFISCGNDWSKTSPTCAHLP